MTSEIWQQYFDVGMRAGKLGDFEKAESNFRAAIAMAPDEPYPHYELGYTMLLQRDYEEALAEFRRTNELARGFFQVQAEIYMCEQLLAGEIDEHVMSLIQRLQQMSEGKTATGKQAEEVARDIIRFSPNCALGHLYLGKALLRKDPVQAEASLERCLELTPDETTAIDAQSHIGLLWSNDGRSSDARQLWSELRGTYAGHPQLQVLDRLVNGDSASEKRRSTSSFWQKLFGQL
ncbi:MAG: tetratricopeptide repeat protein [Synechococcus sp.]